jgi:segregation and condensation protein B
VRGGELAEVGGWQFRTALDLAAELATVMQKPRRLPRAALEMLAIVAQYQPVTRAEIEDIRGVAQIRRHSGPAVMPAASAPTGQRAHWA